MCACHFSVGRAFVLCAPLCHCRRYPKADDLTDGFWDKFPPLTDQAFRDHFQEGLQQYATYPWDHTGGLPQLW